MTAMDERERIMNALRYCMPVADAELLLLAYEASFECENYSDTWPGCPEMTGGGDVDNEEYWDHPWCRTCMARFNIGLPSTVKEQRMGTIAQGAEEARRQSRPDDET